MVYSGVTPGIVVYISSKLTGFVFVRNGCTNLTGEFVIGR